MVKRIILWSFLLTTFSVWAGAQTLEFAAPSAEARPRSSVGAEFGASMVEPLSKLFRMSIPFDKAVHKKVSPPDATAGHQYVWDNFSEGFIIVQFFEYPAGIIPRTPEGQKRWARERALASFVKGKVQTLDERDITIDNVPGMEYDVMFQNRSATIRVFANDDVYYALTFMPVFEDAGPTIERLFDSFEFIREGRSSRRWSVVVVRS